MLFDTHAHYDDEAFDPDRREVLAGLPQKGVGLVVDPGCTLTSSEKAVALAAEFPHVYAAVGLHPENCHDFQPEQIERLRQLARREKVVAIGEVGLDYYWEENPPRALQQEVLRRQLALAEELKLPVIFHDREAHGDSLAIVREFPAVRGCSTASPAPWRWRRSFEAGVDAVLQRGHHLQKRPEGTGGHRRRAAGADDGGDRRSLSDAGTLPGKAQRLRVCASGGGENRPAEGIAGGTGGAPDVGERRPVLRYPAGVKTNQPARRSRAG